MKYLLVVADTNDADYIDAINRITDEELEIVMPIFEKIKNFKPYEKTIGIYHGERTCVMTYTHNFPYMTTPREGEKSLKELYGEIPEIFWNFIPYEYDNGIHSITSVEILVCSENIKII